MVAKPRQLRHPIFQRVRLVTFIAPRVAWASALVVLEDAHQLVVAGVRVVVTLHATRPAQEDAKGNVRHARELARVPALRVVAVAAPDVKMVVQAALVALANVTPVVMDVRDVQLVANWLATVIAAAVHLRVVVMLAGAVVLLLASRVVMDALVLV